MHSRSSLSQSQRERLVELFEQGMGSQAAARVVGVSRDATRTLYRRFQLHGRLCLVQKRTYSQYSYETKKEVVKRHLAGETKMDLAREFGLSSVRLGEVWSQKWRKGGDEALRPKPKGRPKGSSKPQVLTEEEKLRREVERLQAENAYLKKCETSGIRDTPEGPDDPHPQVPPSPHRPVACCPDATINVFLSPETACYCR